MPKHPSAAQGEHQRRQEGHQRGKDQAPPVVPAEHPPIKHSRFHDTEQRQHDRPRERGGAPGQGDHKFCYGRGCPNCNHTGYKGRKALTELLVVNNEIREMIANEAPANHLREKARELGMRTLREDGLAAVMNGETTVDEVVRYT